MYFYVSSLEFSMIILLKPVHVTVGKQNVNDTVLFASFVFPIYVSL